ncbi:MAG: hypothetical protein H6908_03525 [Hyphomicrobiales bacterium]|nr:hypothetical protein [Hyphomicrobiales bacterium]
MSMEWYRVYHTMPYDPKLQVIARRAGQPVACVVAVWICVLDAASQHDPRGIAGIDAEEIAVMQGLEVEASCRPRCSNESHRQKGNVVNWHKRQHTTGPPMHGIP